MQISHPRAISFRGHVTELCVLRSDGFCWGRIKAADGAQFDVNSANERGVEEDLYDKSDADALDALERYAMLPANVEPARRSL